MIRSSARLKSKAASENISSAEKSKPFGKKGGGTSKPILKHDGRVAKKLDAQFKERDTAGLLNESVTTRSGKKAGPPKGFPSQTTRPKAQLGGKYSQKAGSTPSDRQRKALNSKDQKEKPEITGSPTESNHPATQHRPPQQSRRNSETNQQLSEKTKPVKKKDVPHDTTVLNDAKKDGNDWNKTPTVLLDWVIKPVPNCRGICVEGQIEGREDFWHSTAIVEAVKPKLVVTASGSRYELKGKINKLLAFDYGISKDIAKAFTNGFPSLWKDLIEDYYQIMEQSITVTQECMSPEKFQALKTKRRSLNKTVLEPVDIHTILTPTGLLKKEMNRSELTTTRSGRMSLPPLAGWAGQHYLKVPGENSVQVTFTTDTAKQALGKETMHALALSKRDQQMLCQSAMSKSLLASSNSAATGKQSQSTGSAKQMSRGSKTLKEPSEQKLSDSVNSIGKENSLDISFQPEVSLTDCLTPSNHTSLKSKDKQENSSPKRHSSKREPILNKQNRETANVHPADTKNTKQVTQNKRKKQSPGNVSITKRSRKAVKNDFTNLADKTVDVNNHGQEDTSTDAAGVQPETLQTSDSDVQTKQSAARGRSAHSKPAQTAKNSSKKSMKGSRKRKADDAVQGNDLDGKDAGKTETQRKAKKQKLEPTKPADEGTWTEDETDKFYKALREVDGQSSDYWILVSQRVGSRSVAECQLFHKQLLQTKTKEKKKPAPKKPANSKKGKGREKGGPIRGGKNTLKRKQDIRDFLDEQNEGYEDDPFEGTPFVKVKQFSLLPDVNIDFNKDESEIFGTNHNFFTPVAGKNPFDTPGLKFKAQLASAKKTPVNQTVVGFKATPQTVDTRKHDICIKHIMDQKKKAVPSKVLPPQEDLESSILPIKSLFPGTPNIFMDNIAEEAGEDEDDDDEDNDGNQFMYYFSDDED